MVSALQPLSPPLNLQDLQQDFEHASPQEVLQRICCHFGDDAVVVTSFQVTGVVTLHMLQAIMPNVRVFTLDTGVLFPETYALIDDLKVRWNLNLTWVRPQKHVPDGLWNHDPDACCGARKVIPLRDTLQRANAKVWISGLRRDQSAGRSSTQVIDWDARNGLVKVCPFATWTEDMIWTYIHAHDLPYNALYEQGYPSIGCYPCTAPAAEDDRRAGRWASLAKTECGIHM